MHSSVNFSKIVWQQHMLGMKTIVNRYQQVIIRNIFK
jgi:hypothetical protein